MTWAAFVKRAYQAARDWGMQPSEFWGLSPWEWWTELDAKVAESRAIEERIDGAKAGKSGGTFSKAEWTEARRKHAEKIKAMT